MDFQGKNVLYVGGFGGIGFSTCKLLIKRNIAALIIADLQENAAHIKELTSLNPSVKVIFMKLDLCNKDEIVAVVKEAVAKLTNIDVLINGSGIIDERNPHKTIMVNLLGLIHTTLNVIPHMDKGNGGRGGMVVNIASVLGLEPGRALAVYTASKHGVLGFSRSISNQYYYDRTGVSIITICPGITATSLLPTSPGSGTFPYSDPLLKKFFSAENQSPDGCAVNLMKAMDTGKNGSVWILDLGQLEEVNFHKYWTPTMLDPK